MSASRPSTSGSSGISTARSFAEPDRLVAQVGAHEVAARGRRVALVEHEVEDGEHRAQPLGEQVVGRHAERDARSADLPLRAHEPLRHRRLGDEERARDLAVVSPPTSRSVSATRLSAASAGWQHVKTSASRSSGIALTSSSSAGSSSQPADELRLPLEDLLAADAVDRAVARGRDDPGAGRPREPVARPALERRRERVLHRVLGELEVAEDAREDRRRRGPIPRGRHARPPAACRRYCRTGRISIDAVPAAAGISAASRIASSRSGSSMRKTPPRISFVSANGPSVTMRSPSRTRTTFAVVRPSSSLPDDVRVGLAELLEERDPLRHLVGAERRLLARREGRPTPSRRRR